MFLQDEVILVRQGNFCGKEKGHGIFLRRALSFAWSNLLFILAAVSVRKKAKVAANI